MISRSRIAISVVLSSTILLCSISCKTHRKAVETIDNRVENSQETKENTKTKTLIAQIDTTDVEYYKIEFYPPSDTAKGAIKSISGLTIAKRAKTDKQKQEVMTRESTEQSITNTNVAKEVERTNQVSSFNWLAILAVAVIIITISKFLKR